MVDLERPRSMIPANDAVVRRLLAGFGIGIGDHEEQSLLYPASISGVKSQRRYGIILTNL